MPTERISNLGYLGLKKESTKGTAVTPNVYVPLYEESFITDTHIDQDSPINGLKFGVYQTLQGMRSHSGSFKVLAEPNTAGYIFDMLLTHGSPSGGGPYTHPFTLSPITNPNSYTIDIAKGQIVFRYIGVEASQIEPDFEDNKMVLNVDVSGLKAFTVRELASTPTGTNPYTIVFKTNYDPSPTTGLVVSDTIRLFKADGSTVDCTVASIIDGTSITTTTDVTSGASGDYVALRPATPSFTLVSPFLWSRSEFRFSDTASNALSASQTRLEKGSKWTIRHEFEDEEGAKRSGAFDPAALVRKKGFIDFTANRFFDTPEELNRFMTVSSRACVARHFSETGYELRVTMNDIRPIEGPVPLKDDEIIYQEINYVPVYKSADSQAFDVKILNAVSSF